MRWAPSKCNGYVVKTNYVHQKTSSANKNPHKIPNFIKIAIFQHFCLKITAKHEQTWYQCLILGVGYRGHFFQASPTYEEHWLKEIFQKYWSENELHSFEWGRLGNTPILLKNGSKWPVINKNGHVEAIWGCLMWICNTSGYSHTIFQ